MTLENRRERFEEWVEDDPRRYEEAILAAVRTASSGLRREVVIEELRLVGHRPNTRLEILFRSPVRPACVFGWRWRVWEKDVIYPVDEAEMEIVTGLMEWLDLDGRRIVTHAPCKEKTVVWIAGD